MTAVEAPLSFAQEGLWLTEQMFPSLPQFVLMRAFRLRGGVDGAALSGAVVALGVRHETLRTSFVVDDGQPRQRVRADVGPRLVHRDLRAEGDPLKAARQMTEECSAQPFDLVAGPPMRAVLLQLADDDHVLVLAAHHLVIDLWSWPALLEDLSELYAAERQDRPPKLADIATGTTDYARWQRSRANDPEVRDQLEHWRRELDGVPSALSLPVDKQRQPGPSRGGGVIHRPLRTETQAALGALCKVEGVSVAMVALAALGALLARYTREPVLTVGLPVAGDRHRPEVERLVGMFVNVLPAKVDLRRGPTFRALVRQAKMTVFDVLINQDVPYELLLRTLLPDSAPGVMHYEQVALNVRHPEPDALALDDVEVTEFPGGRWYPPGDLTLTVDVGDGRTDMVWIYDETLFDPSTIAEMAEQLDALVSDGLARPDTPVADLRVAAPHRLAAAPSHPKHAPAGTITGRFAEWVRRTPDAPAVAHGDRRWTYAELDRRAEAIAAALRGLGVRRETAIGVCLDRSPDLIAAFLAVLKAGGAYVPVDPEHPAPRRHEMLAQAGATVVICDGGPRQVEWAPSVRLLDPRSAVETPPGGPLPLPPPGPPDALAYVMFTSGSTGRPKGVAITHRGVLGLVVDANYVTVSTTDRVAMTSGVSSDLITFEIWGPLLNGASVHIIDRDVLLSPRDLAQHLTARGITVMSVAAAIVNHGAYREHLAAVPSLRTLHFGGEAGSPASARALLEAGLRASLLHNYGPTETTMLATFAQVTEVRPDRIRLPIGYPVSATEVYVMDEWLRPLPPGMPGKICVAGERLARGYLGRPALTAERFCPNPMPGRDGQLMYRTGDLGRLLADGQLEVLGRSDRQVKIRGFRVEPAEVEQALVDAPEVAQATVVARADQATGQLRLVGYVTAMPGQRVSVHSLREDLSRRLPGYLVPSSLVVLPELPLTASGKVDQRALPPPEEYSLAAARLHHPLDPRERTVASAMAELLGLPAVGRDDDFFALGGHSLLAVQLIDVLHRRGLDVPMARLLVHPTVAGLARGDGPVAAERGVLVLVHGGGGGVGAYAPLLAEVRDRYRCVLVEAREASGLSVTELAAGYVEQVRGELSGPAVAFAGWSVGGLVAIEMARQWQRSSGILAPVLMVDTWPGPPPEAGHGNVLASFVYDMATSAGVPPPALPSDDADPGRALAAVLDQLRPLPGFARLDTGQLLERFELFRALSEAVAAHQPYPYDGPVTLVEAAGSPAKQTVWAPLCPALRAATLSGDHYSVLRESAPALAGIGAALLVQPDASRADPSPPPARHV